MRAIRISVLCLTLAGSTGACARSQSEPGSQAADTQAQTAVVSDSILPDSIVEITWEWVGFSTPVEQITVDSPDRYTLRFGQDGRVAMCADCNRGMGSYSVTPDRHITFGPIALTRAMCPQGSLSDRFAREVGRATIWFMRDGDLYFDLPMDSGTLRFRRQA
jgi:para-nitrobenzyl esterase